MPARPDRPIGRGYVVDRLVADLAPVRPRRAWNDFAALAVLALIEIGLVVATSTPRADMPVAMTSPMYWWKLASCLAVALAGTAALVVALNPDAGRRAGRRLLLAVAAGVALVAVVLVALRPPAEAMAMTMNWRDGLACIVLIEVFALPLLIGAMVVARHAAPAYPRSAILAASVASSGWGAVAFNWRCPHDEPMYVLVWFGLAVALNAGVAVLVLPRWLRW